MHKLPCIRVAIQHLYLHVLGQHLHSLRHDAVVDGLQNSVRQLNKLCKSIQIVREYNASGDSSIDRVVTAIRTYIYYCIIIIRHHRHFWSN